MHLNRTEAMKTKRVRMRSESQRRSTSRKRKENREVEKEQQRNVERESLYKEIEELKNRITTVESKQTDQAIPESDLYSIQKITELEKKIDETQLNFNEAMESVIRANSKISKIQKD